MMKRLYKYLITLTGCISALAITSCSGSDEPSPRPDNQRTVLVYMIADNSLGGSSLMVDTQNLLQMQRAARNGAIRNGRLLVFHDPYGADKAPSLLEITAEGSKELKAYDTGVSSTDPDFMRSVLDDVASIAPAEQNWLVLWSHGTGWIETSDSRSAAQAVPQSFGQDLHPVRREMKVSTLARALGEGRYDVIYFDCCFMGCVEALYELRYAAREIVASATELPVEGMPYDVNVFAMFDEKAGAATLAANTLDYYLTGENVSTRSCTIAVVDTEALDALAAATKKVMQTGAVAPYSYTGVPFFRRYGVNSRTWDMGHYINSLDVEASILREWNAAYSAAVTYYGSTPVSYGLDMTNFTGIGCNIVRTAADADVDGYRNQSWWKDVVMHNPSLY